MTDKLLRDVAALDPVEEADVPDGHGPEADRLLAWVLAQPVREPARRRWRLWLLVPAALLLMAAGWWAAQPAEAPQWVICYREATTAGDRATLHLDIGEDDPVGACAELWEAGVLWSDPLPKSMTSCVTGTGAIGVLPGVEEGRCEAMGWAPLDWDASAHEIGWLSAAIRQRYLGGPCHSAAEARAIAEETLERGGFDHWEIAALGDTSDANPCASIAVHAEAERLLLVPLPHVRDH